MTKPKNSAPSEIARKELRAQKRAAPGIMRPLAERLALARKINDYRKTHKVLVADAIKQLGLAGEVSEGNYWAWRKRLELADAQRAAQGNGKAKPENGERFEYEDGTLTEFPLAVIPEKGKTKAKPRGWPVKRERDEARAVDDRALAATLLDVAARLLRR